MDPYISEKEQIEQIKQWWSENGWYLIGGAAIAVLGYFGWNQYGAYQDRVAAESSALYAQLRQFVSDDDRDGAERMLAELVSDYQGTPYLDQARLLIAQDNLIRDTDRSIAELRAVVEESDDERLVKVARLRLARVLAYDEQYDLALQTLDQPDLAEFDSLYSEVRGDILVALGQDDEAVTAYTDALIGGGGVNQQLLQLKLNAAIEASQAELDPAVQALTPDVGTTTGVEAGSPEVEAEDATAEAVVETEAATAEPE